MSLLLQELQAELASTIELSEYLTIRTELEVEMIRLGLLTQVLSRDRLVAMLMAKYGREWLAIGFKTYGYSQL